MTNPNFGDFYRDLHGLDPFPWQERLAAEVATSGWPSEIGVPTGLGKSSCLDIAVWWLASQADLDPVERTAPTRIWWVVNRRLLVDATAARSEELARRLRDDRGDGPVGRVAAQLRSLSAASGADPLQVVRLRGGAEGGRPIDPSQPTVLLSTIPMFGSRLLFRGYGSSRSMRPVDAALAGTDSLVLVDEAHLAHHLTAVFGPIGECDRPDASVLAQRPRARVVALTATGSAAPPLRFDLDADDHRHPVVAQRLRAPKPLRVVVLPDDRTLDAALARGALDRVEADPATSCVVFVNTPARARAVASKVEKSTAAVDLLVLTGQQREREAEATRRHVLDPVRGAPAGRPEGGRDRPLVIIATQTLEVGADLDFEHLVTEACGVRALTQRLGRVNRLGTFSHATATYVHAEPKARGTEPPSWLVYGDEPLTVLDRLRTAAVDDIVTASPAHIGDVLGEPGDDPGRAPELLPALLWEWIKTTTPPPGEAPVEPFFSGLAQPSARVTVCWRTHLPADGQRLWPKVRDREVVEVPIKDARTVLDALLGADMPVRRLTGDRVTIEAVASTRGLRPGDVVILSTMAGYLDRHGWNADEPGPAVLDDSLRDQGIPLDEGALARLLKVVPVRELRAVLEPLDLDDQPEAVAELIAALAASTPVGLPPDEWLALLDRLDVSRGVVAPAAEVPRLVVAQPVAIGRVDALDELSAGSAQSAATQLDAHGRGVGARAQAVARTIGLDPSLTATVERAASLHDIGKADDRFQRWLDPDAEATELLAKSSTPTSRWTANRRAAGWPAGGRHEALSARLVSAWLARADPHEMADIDPDLLIHLVVSHHGHARPLLLPADDSTEAEVAAVIDGREVTAISDLSVVDWDQPARFARLCQHYGAWGLALLEAVVRQSDHAVSAGGWSGDEQEVI